MEIIILDSKVIEGIPSASGIVKSADKYYIIGDDSPFLFMLNEEFKTISQIRLIDSTNSLKNRLIKSEKPDFETLEMVSENEIVVFGSGSKSPQRNIFVRILLEEPYIIEKFDISNLYSNLNDLPIFMDSELNIEATAFYNNHLFLFNRRKNLIIRFEYETLLAYIKGEIAFPVPEIKQYILPQINGVESGFSGATALKDLPKIIFTASVENTDNAYDDGEILGSFIGVIDISNNTISDSFQYCKLPNIEINFKVESVTIAEEIAYGETKIVLVTDDDLGNSTIIESLLLW